MEKLQESQIFKGEDWSKTTLAEYEFIECEFIRCNFSKAIINNSSFESCTFTECNFDLCKLPETFINECRFIKCHMLGIDWSVVRTTLGLALHCENCEMGFNTFIDIVMHDSKLIECRLNECDFTGTDLKGSSLNASDLTNAKFHATSLIDVNFAHAKNYFFEINQNKCKGAKFTYPDVLNLLAIYGIKVIDDAETVDITSE